MDTPFCPIHARLNNRRFTVANNAHGLSGAGTVFHYLVEGEAISGSTKAVESAWARRSGV